ncbi:MAG TPA: enoyl-CoA hydratase/isomerase family protein [Syntrophales bacterium]|nr:enoyl-CoA hydratase/isomerase family protein [Syntrophales bacterium]HOM07196.1 enoyl-CoA hydratase/isomerase family protein [Syntrophales bacterium]HOO00238.1 enoyl-CoA hydratase/isomerase family protein [Syntrophales bacterium]HPC01385.1 enoyl-CoA hydratase/isomerase family protein [Syntrophales bacterium]HPQ06725.1 enoyl-CoA hydratase/isomerase family protein [Syntrophales bacterium]
MYQTVIVEKQGGYAVVTLNRPREMNALSREMRRELDVVFAALEGDGEVRAVIVTGGDYVFSAGMDLKEMSTLSDEEIGPFFTSILKYLARIYTYEKPVIAAVGGIALGGGFNLATVCDIIIASESAIFGHPELKFGLNPLFSPLERRVGLTKAKEIIMIGEPIGAIEALRIGLVNKVAPPERFMEEARAMAERLAAASPTVITAVKKVAAMTAHLDDKSALDLEFDVMVRLYSSMERKVRMSEFMTREFLERIRKRSRL